MWWAVLEFLEYAIPAVITLYLIFTKKGKSKLAQAVYNLTSGSLSVAVPLLNDLLPSLEIIVSAFVAGLKAHGGGLRDKMFAPFGFLAKEALDLNTKTLITAGKSTPENAIDRAAATYASTFANGLSSHGVTALFESMFPEKLNSLNGIGPILASMSGFDDVTKQVLEPLYKNAFGKSLEYHFSSIFKPDLPSEGTAVNWHARRFLTDAQLKTIFKYSGLKDEYEKPFVDASYHPVSPFVLSRIGDDEDFDPEAFKRNARDLGYSDANVDMLLALAQKRAVRTFRTQAMNAATDLFEKGLMTNAELDDALDELNYTAEAQRLIKLASTQKRLRASVEDFADGYLEHVIAGEITIVEYRASLHGLGYEDPMLTAMVAKAQAKVQARGFVKEVAATAQLKHERQRLAIQDSMLMYKNREIDLVKLTALLLAAGVDPVVAAGYVVLAKERGQKKLPKPPTPPHA